MPGNRSSQGFDLAVVGAGIIGLAPRWRPPAAACGSS
jgi:hypothetical protein